MTRPRALVTGASRGIGAAVAIELARVGYPVILGYLRNHEAAESTRRAILELGGDAELACFDVSDPAATEAGIATLLANPRPIGVLVNNAGVLRDGPFPGMERAAWESVVRGTLDGFYNVTRPLVMPMVRARWGRIVNMSSVSGLIGNRGQVNYSAAKAGIIGATRSLAQELAKRNITVNAVAPGVIDTEMAAEVDRELLLKMIPMRRFGRAEEVAHLVSFLCSEKADYITGQVISINGGMV